ncbi:MAG: ribose-phosphate diphosphokinase [Sphingobacteriales bacterium JAD_PAG50586_3]|nr:MAG: ribose-phosphate diphosphokinase [Sphingobacteriales bacterium JAD_PAG50586_3]
MILNLDSGFKPLTGTEIEFDNFTFTGGEPHIKIESAIEAGTPVSITIRLNSFNHVGLLCMAADALKRMDAKLDKLVIPYFPAARQDRVMQPGEPLSVKVYTDIINSLGFAKVILVDAHSDVAPALLNNCEVIPNHTFIKKVIDSIGNEVILISPDGGALKKIYKVSEFLGGTPVVECSKHRDTKTGLLAGFKVYADDLDGADCLIVDDICDGGGTFIGLAAELKNKNAGKLYLAVTHGIFSNGFDELQKHFTHIYTTNSIKEITHPSVTQINLNDIL